jgi:urease accessory protein
MDARARLAAMLLADARLPSGGSAHSAGLEAAVNSGLTIDDVPCYLEARLRSVATVDACGAVLAHRIAADWDVAGELGLRRLDRSLAARTPSAPIRAAARQLGRGLARVGARLAPEHPAVMALGSLLPLRAVAIGVVAAALGLGERGAAFIVCYDEAQTIASAALKLLPADPVVNARWVLATADIADRIVEGAVAVVGLADLPAPAAPEIETWTEIHSHERRRLFVS